MRGLGRIIFRSPKNSYHVNIDSSILFVIQLLFFLSVSWWQVRGAPLIAMVAALGLAVEVCAGAGGDGTAQEVSAMLHERRAFAFRFPTPS